MSVLIVVLVVWVVVSLPLAVLCGRMIARGQRDDDIEVPWGKERLGSGWAEIGYHEKVHPRRPSRNRGSH